jgi:hypothetical protein
MVGVRDEVRGVRDRSPGRGWDRRWGEVRYLLP